MNEIKRDFFVSYNKADRQWAKWIASVLEQNGYTCYIQAWDFRKGGNFVLDMQNALINSKQVIAVLSKDFLSSPYCQAEWAAAFTKDPNSEKRLFIPVRISNIKPEGLFSAISYIDLFRVNNEEEAEKLLLHGVDIKNIPRNRPSFPGTPKKRFPGSLPFNNLPFSRNHYFTGREQVFEDICSKFESGKAISLTQAIVGMGGLGKTQTALEYAYRYSDKYKWIWWVHAETELSVIASYKQFAVDMGLMNEEQHDDELIIKTVLNWMDSNDKYLFIYDNADIVSSDTSWWPRNNRANILITTRNKQNHIGEKIDIDVFTENEAVKFLQTRAKINDDLQNASLLANRLGCLPLALEQAAAYIVNNEITYGKYLSLLDNYGLELLEDVDGIKDYSLSIAATLEISIKNIDSEEARQLLYLCSYMAPEDIDEALFEENTELLPLPLSDSMQNGLKSNKVWKQLTRYSLLKKQEDEKGYSMHRLLQKVVRSTVENEQQWALCCLSLFTKTYDFIYGDVESQAQFLKLTPHVEAFLNIAIKNLTDGENKKEVANLYNIGGNGFLCLGYYNRALEWYDKALEIYKKVLGLEHPAPAAIYSNIALIYSRKGHYPKALEWYHEALGVYEKVLGLKHQDTASIYHNIAGTYYRQGYYPEAMEWNYKALNIREKVLGFEHIDTAATYNNIALVYFTQGNSPKALELYHKALNIREKILGLEHPYTATTYNNIARVHFRQEDYTLALEWHYKALSIHEKVLGFEHPDTATTYNNIALVYCGQRDYRNSMKWYNKALKIREKILGFEHPDTANTYNNIADVYSMQEIYPKALEWYYKALSIREKVFDLKHPDIANTYNNIAHVHLMQGYFPNALELYNKALDICEKMLGPKHPDTITIYENISIVKYLMK